eukprot:4605705-Alexandrium_andersonii.AAC.1
MGAGQYMHWDRDAQRWDELHSRDNLLHVISEIMHRRLVTWRWVRGPGGIGSPRFCAEFDPPPESMCTACCLEGTE